MTVQLLDRAYRVTPRADIGKYEISCAGYQLSLISEATYQQIRPRLSRHTLAAALPLEAATLDAVNPLWSEAVDTIAERLRASLPEPVAAIGSRAGQTVRRTLGWTDADDTMSRRAGRFVRHASGLNSDERRDVLTEELTCAPMSAQVAA